MASDHKKPLSRFFKVQPVYNASPVAINAFPAGAVLRWAIFMMFASACELCDDPMKDEDRPDSVKVLDGLDMSVSDVAGERAGNSFAGSPCAAEFNGLVGDSGSLLASTVDPASDSGELS